MKTKEQELKAPLAIIILVGILGYGLCFYIHPLLGAAMVIWNAPTIIRNMKSDKTSTPDKMSKPVQLAPKAAQPKTTITVSEAMKLFERA